jgi:N-acyl-D-amino-acid deacylase
MSERFDVLIRGATVVDGTGAQRFQADLGILGERIARIGRLDRERGEVEIDAGGLVAAPGFIDAHTHDDRLLLSSPDMAPKVSQGVTTVVAGNCGVSLAPCPHGMHGAVTPPLDLLDDEGDWFRFPTFAAYVEELRAHPPATNCALLVGHTALRVAMLDHLQRPATTAERRRRRW